MENKLFCCTDCAVVEGWKVIKKCCSRKIFFLLLSIVFTDINKCNDDVCDANANGTNTNGFHNWICKEGYIGDGQSCQCILEER